MALPFSVPICACVAIKLWQIGVPIRDLSLRRITNLCNLSQIVKTALLENAHSLRFETFSNMAFPKDRPF